jgi:hypothetical protein
MIEKRGGSKGRDPQRPSRKLRGILRRHGGGYKWSPGPTARFLD